MDTSAARRGKRKIPVTGAMLALPPGISARLTATTPPSLSVHVCRGHLDVHGTVYGHPLAHAHARLRVEGPGIVFRGHLGNRRAAGHAALTAALASRYNWSPAALTADMAWRMSAPGTGRYRPRAGWVTAPASRSAPSIE